MPADHEAGCCSWCGREMSLHSCPAAPGDASTRTAAAEDLLERARGLVPAALDATRAATGFGGRWKAIAARLERVALVQPLTAAAPKIREKAATAHPAGRVRPCHREKAVITLQRLSMSPEIARAIVGHNGVRPLTEICQTGDSISQSATAGTLKNLSPVPEVRQALAEEGIVRVMISLLDRGGVLGSKEYAAKFLRNFTSSNDNLRRAVVSEGALPSLLAYLDGPQPQESAVGALRNLVFAVSPDTLVSLGVLPQLAHVLRDGSVARSRRARGASAGSPAPRR